MAMIVGKDTTKNKILPILLDLIKDENSEVKLNVIQGIELIAKVIDLDGISGLLKIMAEMTKDG